jgi:hypothetical protein
MNDKNEENKPINFIREICKGKTDEELLEAEENFREFLLVIKGMADRLEDNNIVLDFDEEKNSE